jgi:hypothetical protein
MYQVIATFATVQQGKETPNTRGLLPLPHSLLVGTSELGINSDLFSEVACVSFEYDERSLCVFLSSRDDDDVLDRSLEGGCLSLSE